MLYKATGLQFGLDNLQSGLFVFFIWSRLLGVEYPADWHLDILFCAGRYHTTTFEYKLRLESKH